MASLRISWLATLFSWFITWLKEGSWLGVTTRIGPLVEGTKNWFKSHCCPSPLTDGGCSTVPVSLQQHSPQLPSNQSALYFLHVPIFIVRKKGSSLSLSKFNPFLPNPLCIHLIPVMHIQCRAEMAFKPSRTNLSPPPPTIFSQICLRM